MSTGNDRLQLNPYFNYVRTYGIHMCSEIRKLIWGQSAESFPILIIFQFAKATHAAESAISH